MKAEESCTIFQPRKLTSLLPRFFRLLLLLLLGLLLTWLLGCSIAGLWPVCMYVYRTTAESDSGSGVWCVR